MLATAVSRRCKHFTFLFCYLKPVSKLNFSVCYLLKKLRGKPCDCVITVYMLFILKKRFNVSALYSNVLRLHILLLTSFVGEH